MKWYYKYGFTTSQYKGLIIIASFVLLVICVNIYINKNQKVNTFVFQPFPTKDTTSINTSIHLENFNPNQVDAQFLLSTGLNIRLANRITKYVNNGGEFYKKEDLLKIYNIDTSWYNLVKDYVEIPPKKQDVYKPKKNRLTHLKPFNLNTVSKQDLIGFNISESLSETIIKYRSRIKQYSTKEELKKIYGMTDEIFTQLAPFIIIEKTEKLIPELVNLNIADSLTISSLYGIGPTYTKRIIKYRNNLGGFYSKVQLLEVYGMDSVRFKGFEQQIIVDTNAITPIYINSYTFKQLLKHPYLDYERVKSIVGYRDNVSNLQSIKDLVNLEGFNETDKTKLKPYVSFD